MKHAEASVSFSYTIWNKCRTNANNVTVSGTDEDGGEDVPSKPSGSSSGEATPPPNQAGEDAPLSGGAVLAENPVIEGVAAE